MNRWLARLAGLAAGAALCVLAYRQFAWMGTDPAVPISHGINEDWDWQLTLYEVSRLCLADHHLLPSWNPFTQGGVPLLANPESPFLYPPFVLVLLAGTHLGLKLWILLHLGALVFATWAMARELGLGPLTAHGGGLLVLTSAFVPAFVAYGHIMYLPLCWLPLAWIAARRGRWRAAGVCLAMTVLAGGHHLALYGALWLVADAAFRTLTPRAAGVLGAWLLLNLLLVGQGALAWPLGLVGAATLGWAVWTSVRAWRRGTIPPEAGPYPWTPWLPVLGAGLVALLLCGPKLLTLPPLWERAERLAPQVRLAIADPYTGLSALRVLLGSVPRPSGHEGQNVLYSPVPLVLAVPGVLWGLRHRPAWTAVGLFFLVLGWGGSTPVNLLQGLHRLPPFDHIRVVERYSLVWTLFLGIYAGMGARWLARLPRIGRVAQVALVAAVAWHLHQAAPQAARHYLLGPGRPHPIPPAGAFFQSEGELTNWEAVRANRGKPGCWTTAWLEDPGPVASRGEEAYRGEVYLLPGGGTSAASVRSVPHRVTPGRITWEAPEPGLLVVNQNAFRGWRLHPSGQAPVPAPGELEGLLAFEVQAGPGTAVYRAPGAMGGGLMALLGLLVLAAGGRRGRQRWGRMRTVVTNHPRIQR